MTTSSYDEIEWMECPHCDTKVLTRAGLIGHLNEKHIRCAFCKKVFDFDESDNGVAMCKLCGYEDDDLREKELG